METTAQRKRDIIKNIAIVFLIILLLLTFFSTTILNRSLPQVAAQYAYGGQITSSVRASGMTEANENYQVIIEEGRVIRSVAVKRGQEVAEGDILFILEDSESEELVAAMDALTQAKTAYERWKLQIENETEDQQLQIKYANEDLSKIRAKGVSNVDTSAAEAKVRALTKELAGYSLSAAQKAYDDAVRLLDEAQTAFDAKSEQIAALQETLDEKNETLSDMKLHSGDALQSQLLNAQRNLEDLHIALDRAQARFDTLNTQRQEALAAKAALDEKAAELKKTYDNAVRSVDLINSDISYFQYQLSHLSGEETEEEVRALQNALDYSQMLLGNAQNDVSVWGAAYNEAQNACASNDSFIESAAEQLAQMQEALDDQMRTITRSEEDYALLEASAGVVVSPEDITACEAEVREMQDGLKAEQKALKLLQDDLSDKQGEYQTAKENLTAAKQSAKADGKTYTEEELARLIAETEEKLEAAKEELEALQEQSSDGYPTWEAYNEAVTAAQRQVEALKTALERTKESNALDEPSYKTAVERAQKEVDRLSGTVGASVIKAKISGTVGNIAVYAGQKVAAQTVLAEIEQRDRGYTVTLSLTAEQAKRVAVGQKATVQYYWGAAPEAVVESVKPDRNDPQNTRIVTLTVTGDITAGQSFTFSLGEKSANYDVIVPNSAIREDSAGSFVYVVDAKSTPVGNRYTTRRMDVTVITSDESNTAVSGLLGSEFVITTSSAPLTAGQQVRLSGN